jgi:hypothetical protein
MATVTTRRNASQRKPLPPVPVAGSFCGGATTADLLAGVAVLQIDRPEDTNDWYWAAYVVDAGRIIGVQLQKFGNGVVYFLPADLSECDCPDCTFRQRACKHMTALRQALSPLAAGRAPDRKTERDEITSSEAA